MNDKIIYIGLVGSRRRNTEDDYSICLKAVLKVIDDNPAAGYRLVSGGCPKGADSFVDGITEELSLTSPLIHWPNKNDIDPKKHPRWEYAKICFARNTLIARDSDFLIACVAEDRKGGTENTIKTFKKIHKDRLLIDNSFLVELDKEKKDDVVRIC